ncbi:lysozyme [Bartonella rochalimae]|uniref:lysozyme n=1 Tax=Bartonella rochalimae TaxID=395923 RepID=UPI003F688175
MEHQKATDECLEALQKMIDELRLQGFPSTFLKNELKELNTILPLHHLYERRAETMLLTDLRQYERAVEKAVYVDLSDEQFGALVSFCYNIGITAFQNSTLLKKLNKGDYESVPIELQKWTKAGGKRLKGLVHRRAVEVGLWAKSAYVSSNYQLVEKQESPKLLKAEILAPLIASFSGIAELLEGSGPVQWVLATIIVLASCVGLILIAKRLREERL